MSKVLEIPLEDELGDVLDKALCLAGLTSEVAARKAELEHNRLLDALDWRSELNTQELQRLARVLNLNEVGLCALASGSYPIAADEGLPFCLHALRMTHGIGVANAYIISECCSDRGILFDTGTQLSSLLEVWPASIRALDAVFITHIEPEHTGGLCEVISHFDVKTAYIPQGALAPCGEVMSDGAQWKSSSVSISALNTPGHCAAHNSYVIEGGCAHHGRKLLISGDLLFAGSIGCAFYCREKLFASIQRVLSSLPPDTLIAPGHGPLTTVGTEARFNPFVH